MTAAAIPQRLTRIGAYALCLDDRQRVLLCRIAPGYPFSGLWTLPGGGVEYGEDPNVAVIRELAEETGLVGRIVAMAGVWSRHHGSDETSSGNELHAVGIIWRVDVDPAVLRVEVGGSTDAVAWFSQADAADARLGDLAVYGLSLLPEWT